MIKAYNNKIIVKIIKKEQKTTGGLLLPEESMKDLVYWQAQVVDSNKNDVKVNDIVIFDKYSGSTLEDSLVSVNYEDILGIEKSTEEFIHLHNNCNCSEESQKTRCSKCCLELTEFLITDSPAYWQDCCGNINCATAKEVHSRNKFPFRCEMKCINISYC